MSANGYGLGRRVSVDARDARYPLRALLASTAPVLPRRRFWRRRQILHQGNTPRCVAFSGYQWGVSWPVPDMTFPGVDDLYRGAQDNDEWPGSDYDGSSARGLMRYLQARGLVGAYHWTTSATETLAYVLTQGGVLLGTPLFAGMGRPDANHVMRPTGGELGGHEMYIRGAERGRGRFRVTNSWGTGWADRGEAWLLGEDLDWLLARGADICAPTQIVGVP